MKLIDKAAVVAEIERTQKILNLDDCGGRSVMAWSEGFKNFLDTLEVKEVDFEKMWKEYFKYRGDMATVNVKHLAKHFFELGLKAQKGEYV